MDKFVACWINYGRVKIRKHVIKSFAKITMDDYHDSAADGNTSTLVTMFRTSLSRYYLDTLGNFFSPRRVPFMPVISDACYVVPTAASHIAKIAIDR